MPASSRRFSLFIPVVLVVLVILLAVSSSGAGSLTPPGAPASTDKPIAETEPRIMLSAATTPGDGNSTFKITQAGSYYLGGNLTGTSGKAGIEIAASNVTVDLRGFALLGVGGSLSGVVVNLASNRNVRVMNGTTSSWGRYGVELAGDGGLIDRISATGCGFGGIYGAVGAVVTHCIANANNSFGILAGPTATIESSVAMETTGIGISALTSSVVSHCTAYRNDSQGILLDGGSIVTSCTVRENGNDGIRVGGNCRIVGNTSENNGQSSAGAGIYVNGSFSRIEDNHVSGNNNWGLRVDGVRNFAVRNTANGNGPGGGDFFFQAPNTYGQVEDESGGSVLVTNPWSNFRL